ncbi:hypothetical protein NK356_08505 [Chryseobacterium sp. S0630]|uniref:hypothetical protein n=1 Tax=Chryseobacterium sp. S0630 TaxID=2957803 RepID=UPI00209E9E5A|nr:hypothetical protein [Chryseobacterium sp. S0630]MCP1299202.1 hypothetical protein [Chryseobacterium sp. S0630]
MLKLKDIIKLSLDENHNTEITLENVICAKNKLDKIPTNKSDLLKILVAMNLINAALKRKEFKSKEKGALIYYGMLKPKVSTLLNYMLDVELTDLKCDFYIDKSKKCAYIEVDELQFSFHDISITEKLQIFIDSDMNKPKPWKEIRLQKIAGELFNHYINDKSQSQF